MTLLRRSAFFIVMSFTLVARGQVDMAAVKEEHQEVQAAFEQIVSRFVDFFQTKQKLLHKFDHQKSKTGIASYVIEVTCKEVTYGVNSTGSPQAPYGGHIVLKAATQSNRNCGNMPDVTILGPPAGWDNVNEALENNKASCFKTYLKATQVSLSINFIYKEGRWQFDGVGGEQKNETELAISAALGKVIPPANPVTDPEGIKFNQKWVALVKS